MTTQRKLYAPVAMTDVTAVVLTVGEPYSERALASVARQTRPPADVITVTGEVRPFHRAINEAAARIKTPFFVQVDADMILDPTCIETLRALMRDDVAMTVGALRDPLLGRIAGVRLYRTGCIQSSVVPDAIAPMTAFETAIEKLGWLILYAVPTPCERGSNGRTLGEHRPDYTASYTFAKFLLSGARNRYRMSGDGFRLVFGRLRTSPHPAASLAQIAAAHGIFRREQTDQLGRMDNGAELERLQPFLQSSAADRGRSEQVTATLRVDDLRVAFRAAVGLGIEMRKSLSYPTFISCLERLARDDAESAWVATIGLCHGLFLDRYIEEQADGDFDWLKPLLRLAITA